MSSWRESTHKQYCSYAERWLQFCSEIKADLLHPNVSQVLNFLIKLYHTGIGHSALNTARSAVSALCSTNDGVHVPLGTHPLVRRFMKGVFNLRPTKPRYSVTWDVNKVLDYIRSSNFTGRSATLERTNSEIGYDNCFNYSGKKSNFEFIEIVKYDGN